MSLNFIVGQSNCSSVDGLGESFALTENLCCEKGLGFQVDFVQNLNNCSTIYNDNIKVKAYSIVGMDAFLLIGLMFNLCNNFKWTLYLKSSLIFIGLVLIILDQIFFDLYNRYSTSAKITFFLQYLVLDILFVWLIYYFYWIYEFWRSTLLFFAVLAGFVAKSFFVFASFSNTKYTSYWVFTTVFVSNTFNTLLFLLCGLSFYKNKLMQGKSKTEMKSMSQMDVQKYTLCKVFNCAWYVSSITLVMDIQGIVAAFANDFFECEALYSTTVLLKFMLFMFLHDLSKYSSLISNKKQNSGKVIPVNIENNNTDKNKSDNNNNDDDDYESVTSQSGGEYNDEENGNEDGD